MRRREFIILMGGAIATCPSVVGSQQAERIRRVAVLTPFTEEDGIERDDVVAFTQDFRAWAGKKARTSILNTVRQDGTRSGYNPPLRTWCA